MLLQFIRFISIGLIDSSVDSADSICVSICWVYMRQYRLDSYAGNLIFDFSVRTFFSWQKSARKMWLRSELGPRRKRSSN
jgi:hypothetical protein